MGLSDSAIWYRNHPEGRRKKAKKDKEINKRPEQKRKRAELNRENRRRGTYGNGDKKDLAHHKSGLWYEPESKNRGSKSAMPGDRKARGRS